MYSQGVYLGPARQNDIKAVVRPSIGQQVALCNNHDPLRKKAGYSVQTILGYG